MLCYAVLTPTTSYYSNCTVTVERQHLIETHLAVNYRDYADESQTASVALIQAAAAAEAASFATDCSTVCST
jgi:hypothetical protein